jgi:hypothetical protein
VLISFRTLAIPAELFLVLSQSLQANAGIVTQAVALPLPAKALFSNCCVIQSFVIQAIDNMVN